MTQLLTIETRTRGERTFVTIAGVVDETADFSPLDALDGAVEINLAKIRRLNSIGVRMWIDTIKALGKRCEITFVECSRAVVQQLSMISGFLGNGTIGSFHAPMRCGPCDVEVDLLVTPDAYHAHGSLPAEPCPRCRQPMELDELEEVYLDFLRTPGQRSH